MLRRKHHLGPLLQLLGPASRGLAPGAGRGGTAAVLEPGLGPAARDLDAPPTYRQTVQTTAGRHYGPARSPASAEPKVSSLISFVVDTKRGAKAGVLKPHAKARVKVFGAPSGPAAPTGTWPREGSG